MLNGSPAPMPGAPLKVPVVLVMRPKLLVFNLVLGGVVLEGPPDPGIGRFTRLNRLNISTRNWALIRSVIGVFFTAAKSTPPNPGPRRGFMPAILPAPPRPAGRKKRKKINNIN